EIPSLQAEKQAPTTGVLSSSPGALTSQPRSTRAATSAGLPILAAPPSAVLSRQRVFGSIPNEKKRSMTATSAAWMTRKNASSTPSELDAAGSTVVSFTLSSSNRLFWEHPNSIWLKPIEDGPAAPSRNRRPAMNRPQWKRKESSKQVSRPTIQA